MQFDSIDFCIKQVDFKTKFNKFLITALKKDTYFIPFFHISRVVTRGKNNSTYYFLIPKSLRDSIKNNDMYECIKIGNDFVFTPFNPTDNKEKKK